MPVRVALHRLSACSVVLALFVCAFWCGVAASQQDPLAPEVPPQFKLDIETAARMRPQLAAQSIEPLGPYATGRLVFERLVAQIGAAGTGKFAWALRVVKDDQFNAFSSPDGTVYVESGLADLAGPSTGLWAAILAHEIAHVVRRDWARRYLFQKVLEHGGGAVIALGDPSLPAASWSDSEKASADFGRFCRQMELDADRESLQLMARAGYHPDFVPALHHLLHARSSGGTAASLYAMHPCWEERDRELSRAYDSASIEFARHWREWYASPGGNPPVLVFAEEPRVRKTGSTGWEIQIPMRCQNLVGAVEVVLHSRATGSKTSRPDSAPDLSEAGSELRQLTGCTSPRTTITFSLTDPADRNQAAQRWTDVYVLDAWGAVLARADLPKLRR
jgi:Zn-dependent protease with chaperone function